MHLVKTYRLAVPLFAGLLLVQAVQAETWSDSTGKFTIEAKFLSVSGGNVYLEKTDGTTIAVPIKRLSPESLEQAKRLYKEAMASGSAAPAKATAMPATAGSSGVSKLGANPTAEETSQIMTKAAAEFDFVTLWDGFPAKHQGDIEETVRLAANSLDAQTWNSVASLLKKASTLVSEKKEFFMNNQMIAGMIPNTPETNAIWDAAADMLDAYANCSLTDQSAMKNFSMSDFIANDVPKMRTAFAKLRELTETMEDSPFGAELPQIEVLNETANEATLRVTQGGNVEEQRLVKVENRWLPADMVEGWDEGLAQVRTEMEKLSTPEGQQNLAGFRMGLMMASAPVDQLLAADSQESFDAVIGQLQGMAMQMMGGMGGPGGPGGPGFGPGGPGGPGFGPGGPGGGPPPGFGEGPEGPGGGPPPGFGEDLFEGAGNPGF